MKDRSRKLTNKKEQHSFKNEKANNPLYLAINKIDNLKRAQNNFAKAIYLLDQSPIITLVIDLQQTITWANNSFCRFLGYKSVTENIIKRKLYDLIPLDFTQPFYEKIWQAATDMGYWEGQVSYFDSNNDQVFHWMKIFPFTNTAGRISSMGILLYDLSNTKMMKDEIKYLAYYDSMTSLPNNLALQEDITNFLHYNHQEIFHVIMVKITNLGKINVIHGTEVGDRIISAIIKRLEKYLSVECRLYRYVGDTFSLFSSRFKEDYLFFYQVESMNEDLSQPYIIEDKTIHVLFRFGISTYPYSGNSYIELVNKAEVALNDDTDKTSKIVFYTKEISNRFSAGQALIERLKIALEKDQLTMHYQPIISVKSGSINIYEALLRWNDEVLGYVSPVEIIQQAEANKMMNELGYYIIEKVFRQGLILKKIVSINLNLSQLEDPYFVSNVLSLVEKYQIAHANVAFELVEHVNLENSTQALRNLTSLAEYGFYIGLDDFGTGFSSFTLLNNLSIQFLKVDNSFVKDISLNLKRQNITKSIVDLCKNFSIYSICEGVETINDYYYIKGLSANYAQGYFFSKPLPIEQIEKMEEELLLKIKKINQDYEVKKTEE